MLSFVLEWDIATFMSYDRFVSTVLFCNTNAELIDTARCPRCCKLPETNRQPYQINKRSPIWLPCRKRVRVRVQQVRFCRGPNLNIGIWERSSSQAKQIFVFGECNLESSQYRTSFWPRCAGILIHMRAEFSMHLTFPLQPPPLAPLSLSTCRKASFTSQVTIKKKIQFRNWLFILCII